jgi:hypothetical protein
VDQNLSPRNETEKFFTLTTEAQSHSTFVRIEVEKQSAFLWIDHTTGERPAQTRCVTERFFYFHHIRAKVAHQFGRIRGGHHVTEFKDFHSFEAMHRHFSFCK